MVCRRQNRGAYSTRAGVKVDAFNNRVLVTAAAFHVMRNNVFSLVSDIPVFNDQLTRVAKALVELALEPPLEIQGQRYGYAAHR